MSRPIPEVNAGSTADIAFLLLIFFLVTTTMGADSGLQRRLPPMPDENQKVEDIKINRRNTFIVKISERDGILAGGQVIDISQLKDLAVEFLSNPNNLENLPESEEKFIEGFGKFAVSKGVISLQNTRGTSYNVYLKVQNELVKAVNEVRDEFAMQNFGKKYAALTEDEQRICRDAVPQNISEAEPKDIKK